MKCRWMNGLSDVSPKILIYEADANVDMSFLGKFINVYVLKSSKDKLFTLDAKNELVNIDDLYQSRSLMVNVICGVALTENGYLELNDFKSSHKIIFDNADFEIVKCYNPSKDFSGLILKVIHYLSALLDGYISLNVTVLKDLAALRNDYFEVLQNFTDLESSFNDVATVDLHIHPDESFFPLEGVTICNEWFLQYLPRATGGFAGIELLVSDINGHKNGSMVVEIVTENYRKLASWVVKFSEISDGWIMLTVEKAFTRRLQEGLMLRLLIMSENENVPKLSLGAQTPSDLLALKNEKTLKSIGRPLAMKIYTALPGVNFKKKSNSLLPYEQNILQEIMLAEYDFKNAIPFNPKDNAKFRWLNYIATEKSLQVHPVLNDLSIARIPLSCPLKTKQIISKIKTCHPQGPLISYGMFVFDNDADVKPDIRFLEFESLAWSGWHTIRPNIDAEIIVLLNFDFETKLDLYLVTHLNGQSSADFGWARFQSIKFLSIK